jgi:peptidyl-dipeptidase A
VPDVEKITEIPAKDRNRRACSKSGKAAHDWPADEEELRALVDLSPGARELGFADTGAMWRSRYDMAPDAFAGELDRLWERCARCISRCTRTCAPGCTRARRSCPNQTHPGALLGNIWAQDWSNVYDPAAPRNIVPTYSLDKISSRATSRPPTWCAGERSSPRSASRAAAEDLLGALALSLRSEAVCHASARARHNADDLRIKMCTIPRLRLHDRITSSGTTSTRGNTRISR